GQACLGSGRPGRDADLHRIATAPREAGEHRVDQARNDDVEAVGLRPRLGAPVEQRLVGTGRADVEIELAMIFDIAVDAAAVPERIVPAIGIAAAPAAPPEARGVERTEERIVEARTAVGERVLDIADLAAVNRVAELDDHARALRAGRGRIAARLQLLGDDAGVALEFQPAVGRHAFARN